MVDTRGDFVWGQMYMDLFVQMESDPLINALLFFYALMNHFIHKSIAHRGENKFLPTPLWFSIQIYMVAYQSGEY